MLEFLEKRSMQWMTAIRRRADAIRVKSTDVRKSRKETAMESLHEETRLCSRRSILTGSAVLLAGGIVGRVSNAFGAAKPSVDKAPPLPWKWVKLDPLEAGRRAYRAYLSEGG
jgi:hypothetical protein